MIFHCLSIPYSPTNKEHSLCAFVQKVYKFCNEMTKRGHTVYHYGHKDSVVNCTEHITVTDDNVLKESYGDLNKWKNSGYNQDVSTTAFKIFNNNCISQINKRLKSKNEFILCWFGFGHEQCVKHFYDKAIVVEPSIGYDSMFAPVKIFETNSQMHKLHGAAQQNIKFGSTAVIYPGFNEEDFTYKFEKSKYCVFLGRVIEEKGAKLAYEICNHIGQEIYFLGPNILKLKDTKHCKMIGFCDPIKRNEYLSNAKFLLAPSLFTEPCNWAAIESQFCGTPVISTNFGGFTETILHNKTGYHSFNAKNVIENIFKIDNINPHDCYNNAISKFTLKKQCDNYEQIFKSFIH